jgi:hypothetical protein
VPRFGLTAWYVRWKTQTVTYPVKGHTACPGQKKTSAEVPNLSKGEICSNYSLSICPRFLQPFIAIPKGRALKALRSWISSSGTSRGPTIDVFNFGGGRCRTFSPAPPKGPAINVFNFGGGRCQTLPSAPPKGPAIDVFNCDGGCCRPLPSAPPGAHHRCLQLRWWPLLDLTSSTPQGVRHRRLQLWWWPLPDLAVSTP